MKSLQLLFIALAGAGAIAPLAAQTTTSTGRLGGPASQAPATYIITFAEPGLLYNDGRGSAFAPTSPAATGSRKVDARSPAALSYRAYLSERQDAYLAQMNSAVGHAISVSHRYDVTMNGVAVKLTEREANLVRAIPGVTDVQADQLYQLDTDAGPSFIGAESVWNGTATFSALGTRGQGVVVGVFDSGANSDHPSFANDASCGFSPMNPKLIAARDCNTSTCSAGNGEDVSIFVDANNPGSSGHGVHTSSTAVGSVVTAGTLASAVPARFNISGVAPCARLISYKVCGDTLPTGFASCTGAAIQAAIQRSIVDQVDVVNFSISGGNSPWTDNDRGFLDMVNADIVVSASAGNTSATITNPVGAVAHKGPWVMTVANSSHNRVVTNPVSVAGSLQNVPSQASNGLAFTSTVTADVANAVAAPFNNEYGCTASGAFPAASMTGKIALIQRGPAVAPNCGFSEKINNAAAAGAVGVVIYDRTTGAPVLMDVTTTPTTIPAVFIRQAAGYTLRDYLLTSPASQITIVAPSQRVIDPTVADVLNASSLRGPNATFDLTKPDITGPGTNIYAATSDNFGQFGFLTGTSMSSPHLAGSAALLRAAQPTWTPPEVKSAIMLTASVSGRQQDEITPWNSDDVGNGRIDLTKAARSGLVMNETFANFLAANPANGDANLVRTLNLPSMRHITVAGNYTFTRTFRNASGKALTWAATSNAPAGTTVAVVPSTFSFGANAAQTQTVQITVTITAAQAAIGFGDVTFAPVSMYADGFEEGAQMPYPARLTLAIKGTP